MKGSQKFWQTNIKYFKVPHRFLFDCVEFMLHREFEIYFLLHLVGRMYWAIWIYLPKVNHCERPKHIKKFFFFKHKLRGEDYVQCFIAKCIKCITRVISSPNPLVTKFWKETPKTNILKGFWYFLQQLFEHY